jgi:hypothetical protein
MLNILYKYFCCCFIQPERYISFSDYDWTDIHTVKTTEYIRMTNPDLLKIEK